jgi:hypothetical protein
MQRGFAIVAGTGLAALLCGAVAAAQPSIESLPLAAAYGDGVHAYFAGDYERAYEDLTQAIEAGTTDPRAFYFRGLAALRQGRTDEAEADFTVGADRESAGLGAWPVGRSLERIQGADRLRLERHRMRARVALLQRQREAEQLRYSQLEEAQPDVIRRRRPVAPRDADEGNVFEEQPAPAEQPEPAAPAEPMPEPEATEPEEPAAKPAADNPFGDAEAGGSKTEQVERLAAEQEDVAAQRDQQAETEAAAGER